MEKAMCVLALCAWLVLAGYYYHTNSVSYEQYVDRCEKEFIALDKWVQSQRDVTPAIYDLHILDGLLYEYQQCLEEK